MKKLALTATVALTIIAFGTGPAAAAEMAAAPTDADAVTDPSIGGQQEDGSNEPIDADLALKHSTMTPLEVTQDDGIEFTIDSLNAGDVVTSSLGNQKPTTVQKDGPFDGSSVMDSAPEFDSTVDFTVTVEREGQKTKTFHNSVEIIEGDRGDTPEGQLEISSESMTAPEFREDGVTLSMLNCSVEDEVRLRVAKKDDPKTILWETSQTAGEDAAAVAKYIPDSELKDPLGEYTAMADCGELSSEQTFTVTSNGGATD